MFFSAQQMLCLFTLWVFGKKTIKIGFPDVQLEDMSSFLSSKFFNGVSALKNWQPYIP
jgi:hypothetical protein